MEGNKKSFTYTIQELQRVQYQKTFDEDFAEEVKNSVLAEIKRLQNVLGPEGIKVRYTYITPEYICLWNNFDFDLMKVLLDFYFNNIDKKEIIKFCEDKNFDYAAVRVAADELVGYIREDIYTSAEDSDNEYKEVVYTELEEEHWDLDEGEEVHE